jgi:hypothetical protein
VSVVEAELEMRFRIRFTPQNTELFQLYERAAASADEVARLLTLPAAALVAAVCYVPISLIF